MPKPSQVIVLVEDERHEMLARRYLRRCGMEQHQMRIVPFPSGKGSAEQWVRTRYAKEVSAYRHRSTKAATALMLMIDADAQTVDERLAQLAQSLSDAGNPPIHNSEPVARLVPKRNVETWILCLNGHHISETIDYKGEGRDWNGLVPAASDRLFQWTRPNAALPEYCTDSLAKGITELRRLEP